MVSPQVRRQAVDVLMEERGLGVTRACGLVDISRSLYGYRSRKPPCNDLRQRICEVAGEKRRYGYRRIHILLRREGWPVNRKRRYRLYKEAGLAVRRRKRKRIGLFERKPLPKPTTVNRSWSMVRNQCSFRHSSRNFPLKDGTRTAGNREMADRLQHRAAAQLTRKSSHFLFRAGGSRSGSQA